jgi:hypothetical protein
VQTIVTLAPKWKPTNLLKEITLLYLRMEQEADLNHEKDSGVWQKRNEWIGRFSKSRLLLYGCRFAAACELGQCNFVCNELVLSFGQD